MRNIIKSLPRLLKCGPQCLPLYKGRDWKELVKFQPIVPLNEHFMLKSWPKHYRVNSNDLGHSLLVLDGRLMEYAQYNGILYDILHLPKNFKILKKDTIFVAKQQSVTLHTF